uniref:Bestrophin n=1 Tax=Schlesneria paludicola TaxID=360056 RepID=A0A7C2K2S6_9PLAN
MTQYDPHSWTSHLFDLEGSLVREILGRVSLCVGWSAVIAAAHALWPEARSLIEIPETGHALIGVALGLLLVFRTNASYDRFWEGRKMWGAIVNETRNLARQASEWCADDATRVRRIVLWTVAYAYSCLHRLRGQPAIGEVQAELPPDQVATVLSARHVPLAVARRLTAELEAARKQGLLTDYQQVQLDQNVQLLIDYLGACERIHSTPLPYAYAVHLRRALILYCFTLPFALASRFGWETIPTTLIIAYVLFGIEEIGVEIEDPFGTDDNDLPLDTICGNIEATLRDVIKVAPE